MCNEQYANNTVCVYRDAFGDGSIFRFAGGDSNYTDHDGFGADRYSDGDEVNDTGSSFTNWTDRYVVFYKDANSQGEPLVCLAPRQSLSETYNPSSPMGTGDAASSHQLYTYDQFHLLPTVCLQYVKPDGRMIYAYQP
ncbi:MAG TPA: peptidase inhibitor family I36 protein [Acidimicrobiia bacterium]|nr:peptidase inhibitor family I36 protein [Acidimicrobiia bacterium]